MQIYETELVGLYEISDQGGQLQQGDLGPVANPYRLVQYLVIRMARYADYAVDDLRLHAIGLYAGLSTTVPDPVGADGTPEGTIPDDNDYVNNIIQSVFDNIIPMWKLVNFWPRLFIDVDGSTTDGADYSVSVSTDILNDFQIHSLSISIEAEESRTPQQIEEDAQALSDIYLEYIVKYAIIAILGFTLGSLWRIIDTASSSIINLSTFLAVVGLMTCWIIAFAGFLYILEWLISPDGGQRDPWAAATAILGLMCGLFCGIFLDAYCAVWPLLKHFTEWVPYDGITKVKMWEMRWSIISFVLKIVIFIVCIHFHARYLSLGVINRM